MSRVIKFRAWDSELKEMCEPVDLSAPRATYRWLGLWDFPLMQFTGLLDKNGKEIYEGDILKTDSGANMAVSYRDDMACFVCRFSKGASTNIETAWKIIGNVWEHPDLLV